MNKKGNLALIVVIMIMIAASACAPAATPAPTSAPVVAEAPTDAPVAVTMKGSNPDTLVYNFDPSVKAKKNYTIAMIVKSQAAPVWESHLIAGERAAKDMGITFLNYAPSTADNVAEQTAMLEDVATKGVDCVILAPANSKAVQAPVAELVSKGIPVVFDNTLGAGDDYLSFVGVDSTQAGTIIAQTIGGLMKGEGKLLILEGVPGQQTSDDRVAAIKVELDKNFPNIEYKSVVANWMFDQGQKAAEDTLQSWPDLKGVVSVGGNMAEGAAEAVAAAGKTGQVIIGSFDVQSPTVTAMKAGKVAFTISQGVYEQAYYSVAACVMALNGQEVPRQVRTPITVVYAADVDKYDESPAVLKNRP